MAKELFILRSVPGAGKSTIAELIAGSNGIICCADDFLINSEGEYEWSPERVYVAHIKCKEKCENAMKNAFSANWMESRIVIANTNYNSSEYKPYVKMAEEFGFRVHFLIVENRHGGTDSHNVSEEIKDKMEASIRSNIKLR